MKFNTIKYAVVATLTTISFQASAELATDNYGIEEAYAGVGIGLDPSLTRSEKDMIQTDFKHLVDYGPLADRDTYFNVIFSGRDGKAVLKMIDERVDYLFSDRVELERRIILQEPRTDLLGPIAEDNNPIVGGGDERIITMATNIGTAIWFNKVVQEPEYLGFQIGSKAVPIQSSRVGLVQIGRGYTMEELGVGKVTSLVRVSTLVHEARHSDCQEMLSSEDIEAFKKGDLPKNTLCGHMHVTCPKGHDYEGSFACDNHVWGAYTIEGIFALQINKNCGNCGEEEKQQALIIAADALSKVLTLDDLKEGRAGLPNMSSVAGERPKASLWTKIKTFIKGFGVSKNVKQGLN